MSNYMGRARALEHCREGLRSPEEGVRKACLLALATCGNSSDFDRVVVFLGDEDAEHLEAAKAIAGFGIPDRDSAIEAAVSAYLGFRPQQHAVRDELIIGFQQSKTVSGKALARFVEHFRSSDEDNSAVTLSAICDLGSNHQQFNLDIFLLAVMEFSEGSKWRAAVSNIAARVKRSRCLQRCLVRYLGGEDTKLRSRALSTLREAYPGACQGVPMSIYDALKLIADGQSSDKQRAEQLLRTAIRGTRSERRGD